MIILRVNLLVQTFLKWLWWDVYHIWHKRDMRTKRNAQEILENVIQDVMPFNR